MRKEPYFYDLICRKADGRIYGNLSYGARIWDLLNLYEGLSSMEKLEFQEAIRNLLKTGDSRLVEIALAVCTGFIETGAKKEKLYRELQSKILQRQTL